MSVNLPHPIIITGFMGAGKTTVAAALAQRLGGCEMIDLDSLIKEREGRTAQMIIDEDGESRFRQLESRALRAALETSAAPIIALGGGAWTVPANRALAQEYNALTVWLDAPFALCWERITGETQARPLARDQKSARQLYDERRAVYAQATLRIEAGEERSADAIAAEIADALLEIKEQTKQGKP
jgi:shikimate kinase